MEILCCGSRAGVEAPLVREELRRRIVDPATTTIVHGDAPGADRLAAAAALALGCQVIAYRRPDLVLAFWNRISPGTRHTIEEARRRGIYVAVVPV